MPDASTNSGLKPRTAAVAEVVTAFAFVHLTFRTLKHFTAVGRWEAAAGLNFTPGLVMILLTVAALRIGRRSFETYGLTPKRWRAHVSLGLLWSVLLAMMA